MHVRIQVGEPNRLSNITSIGERCESAKQMKIQLICDGILEELPEAYKNVDEVIEVVTTPG
jgi:RNA-splicing ligase RtcB